MSHESKLIEEIKQQLVEFWL